MAIDLSALFGQQPDYSGFISPAEQQRLQSNAGQQALLNSAIALLAQSGRTREPISTGQLLGSALGAGMEGYQQSFDRTLKQMVTGMQLAEFKKKQDAQKRIQEAIQGATKEIPQIVPVPTETGEMPTSETMSALTMLGTPKKVVDYGKLQESLLLEAAGQDPLKFLELQATMAKAGKKEFKQVDLGNVIAYLDPDTLNVVKQLPKQKLASESSAEDDKLRTSFLGQAKPYIEISQAYRKIVSAPDTAPGDMSKIFGYMKILDPGSTVREGEYASAENARGIPEAIRAQYNKVVEGTRLTADQRNKFDQAAGALINSQKTQFETLKTFYSDAALRQNANPKNVIYDPFEGLEIKMPSAAAPEKPKAKASDLGVPSVKGIKFLGFEPTPTGQR
jgi:hypothetical protein